MNVFCSSNAQPGEEQRNVYSARSENKQCITMHSFKHTFKQFKDICCQDCLYRCWLPIKKRITNRTEPDTCFVKKYKRRQLRRECHKRRRNITLAIQWEDGQGKEFLTPAITFSALLFALLVNWKRNFVELSHFCNVQQKPSRKIVQGSCVALGLDAKRIEWRHEYDQNKARESPLQASVQTQSELIDTETVRPERTKPSLPLLVSRRKKTVLLVCMLRPK